MTAWAIEDNLDPAEVAGNTIPVTWPPRSGRAIEVPEIDRVEGPGRTITPVPAEVPTSWGWTSWE